jgi:hypothetical protein
MWVPCGSTRATLIRPANMKKTKTPCSGFIKVNEFATNTALKPGPIPFRRSGSIGVHAPSKQNRGAFRSAAFSPSTITLLASNGAQTNHVCDPSSDPGSVAPQRRRTYVLHPKRYTLPDFPSHKKRGARRIWPHHHLS